jgi:hypothetical protein
VVNLSNHPRSSTLNLTGYFIRDAIATALSGREEGKKGKTLPKPRLDQKQPRLAATRY